VILVDTSIWVDHLRAGHPVLARLLEQGQVLGHPWVVGEIALGSLKQRQSVLGLLAGLPQAEVATGPEVAGFIEHHRLYGLGLGFVDVQLLAAARLTNDARLWTADKRLAAAAARLDLLAVVGAR
jgi:predicted nucleic acid-binding protein